MSQGQASPDESAKTPVKRARRSVRLSSARQLKAADNELGGNSIDSDTLRKVELVRQRVLGKHTETDDPRSVFDWGL